MSGLKRRGRGPEPSYCEEGPSPQFKRLRLDEAQDQYLWGLALHQQPQAHGLQEQPPQQEEQQQQHASSTLPCEANGIAAVDAAAAAAAAAAHAAVLCGDVASYATINALLKQLHEERLQRVAAAGAIAAAGAAAAAAAGGRPSDSSA